MPKINEITEVHSGVTFRKKKKEKTGYSYKIIQLSDLDEFHRLTKGDLSETKAIDPKERHLLQPRDIIFSSKGEYNYATVIPDGLGAAIAVSTFLVLKEIRYDILPGYLAWYINSKEGQDYLSGVRSRTSIPYVSKSNFVKMPVSVPPMESQKLIVKINDLKIREQELQQALQELRKKLIDATLLDHIKKSARKT